MARSRKKPAAAAASTSPGQRQLKRTWLHHQRLIIPAAQHQPHSEGQDDESSTLIPATPPTQAEALAALDGVADDAWASAALLDALSANDVDVAQGQEDDGELGWLRALTDRALKRTQSVAHLSLNANDVAAQSLPMDTLRLLDVRRRAVRYACLLDVYQRMWPRSASTSTSTANAEATEEEEEEDPWADARDATPTPDIDSSSSALSTPPPPLRDFLASSVRAHAYDFASSFAVPELRALLGALPRVELEALLNERFELVHLLLYAGALQGAEVEQAAKAALLPRADAEGNETDAWLVALRESEADEEVLQDASSQPEITAQLEPVFGALDAASLALPPSLLDADDQGTASPLSAAKLAEWYAKLVTELESSTGNATFAYHLAQLVQSASFQLPPSSELERTSQDLRLLNALIHSSQAGASQVHTLSTLRTALTTEAGRRQVALEHVKYARSVGEAEEATRNVVPYLDVMAKRYGVEGAPTHEACVTLILDVLQLEGAQLDPLLLAAAILRTATLEEEVKARLILAAIYGSERTDGGARAAFSVLLDAAPSSTHCDAHAAEALASLLTPKAEALNSTKLYAVLPSLGPARSILPLAQSHVRASKVFAARGGAARMSPASLAASAGDKEAQRRLAVRLLRASETKGLDWNTLRKEVVSMAEGGMLQRLGVKEAGALVLKQVLQSGDLSSARKLLADVQGETMSEAEVEKVVLETSRELYDNAQSANLHRGEMKAAYECLSVIPSTPAIAAEKAFIEGTSKLCSYTTASRLRPGHALSPLEIRLEADRVSLVARMLGLNERAYKTPDLIVEIATKLSGVAVPSTSDAAGEEGENVPPPKALTEVRTWAAVCAAALAAEDFTAAQEACQSLVDKVTALRARAAASRSAGAASAPGSAASILAPAQAEAWQACLQLARHQGWQDVRGRAEIMAHALALCPEDRLASLLPQWRALEAEADAQDANAPAGTRRSAVARRAGVRGGASTSSKESFASPFSALFAQTGLSAGARRAAAAAGLSSTATSAGGATKPKDSAPVGGFGRAAQLFDAFGEVAGGAGAAYYDPAERAAKAARSFFGGLAGAGSERVRVLSGGPAARGQSADGEKSEDAAAQPGGFSISRVGGWLLGEEDKR